MNIDDFLDSHKGQSNMDEDVIDISTDDSSSNLLNIPTTDIQSSTSSTSDSAIDSTSDTNISKPSMQDNANSSSSMINPSNAKTFEESKESMFNHTAEGIISALKQKDVHSAMAHYDELRNLYDSIPIRNLSTKKSMHSVLLTINEKISHLLQHMHHETENMVHKIDDLIHAGEHSLHDDNLGDAISFSKKIKDLFIHVPLKTDPIAKQCRTRIYGFWSKVQNATDEYKTKQFNSMFFELYKELNVVKQLLADKNFSSAKEKIENIEAGFLKLPDVDSDKRMFLHNEITKCNYNIDVLSQISYLQKELREIPDYSSRKKLLKKQANPSPSDSEEVPEKMTARSNYSNKGSVVVDSALKNIKLKKVKLDILRNNFDSAKRIIDSLESQFGSDSTIASMKMLLAKHMKSSPISSANKRPSELSVDEELREVEDEVSKGDFISAERDLSAFKKTHSDSLYKSFATEVEKDVEDAEESYYFNELKKKLNNNLVNNSNSDVTLKKITRKLVLARHQLNKGHTQKAKDTLKEVFRLDPDNTDAQKIMEMVRQ